MSRDRSENGGEPPVIRMNAVATDHATIYQAAGDIRMEPPAYRLEPLRTEPHALGPDEARLRPSGLLAARRRVVDFTGRTAQLRRLTGWRDGPERAAVRLVSGAAGQGKTRLADRFAHASAEAGWQVRAARGGRASSRHRERTPAADESADRLLVLVDYAERWILDDLIGMIDDLAGQEWSRVRVLMLARPAGLWWSGLSHRLENDLDVSAEVMPLPVLAASPEERLAAFTRARDRFAEVMGVPDADTVRPPDGVADDEAYGVALTVHMAALAAVDAHVHAETAPDDPSRLSAYLLDRESDYWRELHAHTDGLPTVDVHTMGRTVFSASLTGPLGHAEGTAVVERAVLAREPVAVQRILDAHAHCYPPQDQATVLEPLYPDRMAEDFIALRIPGHALGFGSDAWTTTALPALLAAGTDDDTPPYARQAVTVLIEAAARWEHVARTQLYPLLRERPRLALAAGGAALVTLAGLPHLDLAVLEAIEPHLPEHHVDFDLAALACAERLTEHRLAVTKDVAERAKLHRDLGIREGVAGLRDRALTNFERSAELFRELPEPRAATMRADHAWALLNLGIALTHEGRHADAYTSLRQAVNLMAAATADPVAAGEGLATSLDTLQVTMAHMGRRREALKLAYLVVEAWETLPKKSAESYARLGRAYLNLGNRLAGQGSHSQAKAATRDGLEIFRRLAADDPDAFTPDLARALVNWSADLIRANERTKALETAEEAVRLYRAMAETNLPAFQVDLAKSLVNLGAMRGLLRLYRAARDRTAEALSVLGKPPASASAAYRAVRAVALAKLAFWHAHLDNAEDAAAYVREAIDLSRTLKRTDSVDDRDHVAGALMPTGYMLAVLGRPDEALLAMEASADMYRELATADESFKAWAVRAADSLATARRMSPADYGAMMVGLRPELEDAIGPIGDLPDAALAPDTPPLSPAPPMKRVQPRKQSRRWRRKP
ncbi:hypothetical protein GCM10023196_082260 [Actinoallomurus vinaceus]|uniref:Tetratricopeptide repeat protein n=1 Tax=Actinoallomurus vinaceus TaxID=1080074 RepID=A0ABP8UPQ5_9ACTN